MMNEDGRKKNRKPAQISQAILEVVPEAGTLQTKVFYGAGLSFQQLNDYREELESSGFITVERNGRTITWRRTPKGTDYLKLLYAQAAMEVPTT